MQNEHSEDVLHREQLFKTVRLKKIKYEILNILFIVYLFPHG